MANHKSAAKRARQNQKRSAVNVRKISTIRTLEKKLRRAITEKAKEKALNLLGELTSKVDRAVKAGVIHKNNASRKKSRLANLHFETFKG